MAKAAPVAVSGNTAFRWKETAGGRWSSSGRNEKPGASGLTYFEAAVVRSFGFNLLWLRSERE